MTDQAAIGSLTRYDTTLVTHTAPFPRLRLGVLLWIAGTLGAAAVSVALLPPLADQIALPAPVWLITLASIFQSAVLIGLAVWGGVSLAPAVGLRAPAFEAAATRQPIMPALGPQILPGIIGGVLGGILLFAFFAFTPPGVQASQSQFTPPLHARVLYGGITEEILLRWGLMTAFTWLAWRFLQGKREHVKPGTVWLAIAASALLFGMGHLPVAAYLLGSLNAEIVLLVVGFNASFGVLFGWLYWRRGLESAFVAHAVAHLVSYAATQLSGGIGAG